MARGRCSRSPSKISPSAASATQPRAEAGEGDADLGGGEEAGEVPEGAKGEACLTVA